MRALVLIATVTTACSSNYMPQSRGRVSVTIRDGKQAYVRDGLVYDHGFLGGGLVDAVEGNARATRAANEYHDRIRTGLIGVLVGAVAMFAGTGYALTSLSTSSDNDHRANTGLLIGLGGMVLTFVGAGYAASAEPYRWDAINMFNDDAAAGTPMQLPSYYTPPRTSMKMRD